MISLCRNSGFLITGMMVPFTGIVALCYRTGGSQTPDRWLNGSRNTQSVLFLIFYSNQFMFIVFSLTSEKLAKTIYTEFYYTITSVFFHEKKRTPYGISAPRASFSFLVLNCFERFLANRLFARYLLDFFLGSLQFIQTYHLILGIIKSKMGISIHRNHNIRMPHKDTVGFWGSFLPSPYCYSKYVCKHGE